MACVLVPAAQAIVTGVASKIIKKKNADKESAQKIPFSRKLGWLSKLQAGGAVLLIFEHVWHGEIVPFFPFLTAASNPADTAEMFHEMATTGVTMAVLTTLVWGGMLIASHFIEKRAVKAESAN